MNPPDDEKWNKAQRLSVAGAIAPVLRSASDKAKMRKVARVDADGKVVGYTTLAEVQEALLARQKIEFEVVDGVKPKEVICELCGAVVEVKKGPVPSICGADKGGCHRQKTCVGYGETEGKCKAKPRENSFSPSVVAKRKEAPWICRACSVSKWAQDPEWRAENKAAIRKRYEDPEYRAKHAAAIRTPEYRAKHAAAMRKLALDPEHRDTRDKRNASIKAYHAAKRAAKAAANDTTKEDETKEVA